MGPKPLVLIILDGWGYTPPSNIVATCPRGSAGIINTR